MENLTVRIPLKQPIVFELEGFYVPPGYGPLFFVLALLTFMVTLLGNGVVLSDPKLSSPMFFFLCNLSLVDMAYTTTTVPNMLSGLVTGASTISAQGFFMTDMAY
uniref:G-protein coupled receptors family 1 profile domain-containing protein n=1 Tax=Salarias fasciatus TaxID=181472 RepID=A0A672HBP0_SALFA